MSQRDRHGGLTPCRSLDLYSYSSSAFLIPGRVIGQYAADDAAFCVGHPDHAKFTAAVLAETGGTRLETGGKSLQPQPSCLTPFCVSILRTLPTMNMHHHTFRIDVAEMQIFAHSLIQRSVEMRRVGESSFCLWSLIAAAQSSCCSPHADGLLSHPEDVRFLMKP